MLLRGRKSDKQHAFHISASFTLGFRSGFTFLSTFAFFQSSIAVSSFCLHSFRRLERLVAITTTTTTITPEYSEIFNSHSKHDWISLNDRSLPRLIEHLDPKSAKNRSGSASFLQWMYLRPTPGSKISYYHCHQIPAKRSLTNKVTRVKSCQT